MKFIGPLFGDLGERALLFLRLADGAVVNVGQVADVFYFIAAELELEQPTDDVVDDEGAKVADVRGRIDVRASIIEADHAVGVRRRDRFEAAVEGIVKLKGHIRRIGKDGVNGILIPARDSLALSSAIEKLVLNPESRNAMGRAGRLRAESEFSNAIVCAQTLDLYRRLLNR